MHIWRKQGPWRTFHETIFCLRLWEKAAYKNKSSTTKWQIGNSQKLSHSLVTFHPNSLQSHNRSLLFNYLHSSKQRIGWCVKFGKFANRRVLCRRESERRGANAHDFILPYAGWDSYTCVWDHAVYSISKIKTTARHCTFHQRDASEVGGMRKRKRAEYISINSALPCLPA